MRTYDETGLVCPYCTHKHEPPFGLEIREPRQVQMFRRWAWQLDRRPVCGVTDPEMGACFEPKGHDGEHNWR